MPTAIVPLRSLVRVYVGPGTAHLLYHEISGKVDFDVVFADRSAHVHFDKLGYVCIFPTNEMRLGINDCLFAVQFTNGAVDPSRWVEEHAIMPVFVEYIGQYPYHLPPMAHVDASTGRSVTTTGTSQMQITARGFEELEELIYRVHLGSFVGFGES